jgi:recombinational DNA repair protein (RecF pathway)
VKCSRCGREISADDSYQHLSETLCEDCYIDIRYPPKACDPWAVYSAIRSRESLGLKGTEGLTELQKAVYGFIKVKGKVTREELWENFGMKETELQMQLVTLRHCELVKGHKENNSVYLVPFDYGE